MKSLVIDATAGMAGDMWVAALLDLGVPSDLILETVRRVVPGMGMADNEVRRGGLRARHVTFTPSPTDRPALHHYSHIRTALQNSGLPGMVCERSLLFLDRLAEAEARVHGVEVADVHFHEAGAWDSIADMVGTAAGLEFLGITSAFCPVVATGSGDVLTEHGLLPVPAPATLDLLKGFRTCGADLVGERTTPTGMAIAASIAIPSPCPDGFCVERTGCGAGSRDPADRPNILRLTLGSSGNKVCRCNFNEKAVLIETNLDDITPASAAQCCEVLLQAGALDVWTTQVLMKKARPGFVLSVLCRADDTSGMARVIITHTRTLGIRAHTVERLVLPREESLQDTSLGAVTVKSAWYEGKLLRREPEFEDLKRLSASTGLPYPEVEEAVRESLKISQSRACRSDLHQKDCKSPE